jgi:hypothetical protein
MPTPTHIWDYIASLHYPNHQAELHLLPERELAHRRSYAWSQDQINERPTAPTLYEDENTEVLEQWRKEVLASIDARVALLNTTSADTIQLEATQLHATPEQQPIALSAFL